ncbi:MAG: DUF2283 domain-containing protein [Oscillatoriophycideae cyanobacterium NC_groundwater_1537_Pr4_S-0.65um_50_18]|nr:DUF2283 domain-containing protein [Oscillatoriophycideae cyanobacterium NC_groundwater_1537_Pr4_S-0.65um_50_18]
MKVIYDAATDVLRFVFRDAIVEDFNEDRPDVQLDYDTNDNLVAIEIHNASKMIENPRSLEHIVLNEST